MENNNIKVKQNLNLEVNAPCPKCDNGHLLPFLKAIPKRGSLYGEREISHYEVYYRCSNYPECDHFIEG